MAEFLALITLIILITLSVFFLIIAIACFKAGYTISKANTYLLDDLKSRYKHPLDGLNNNLVNKGADDIYTSTCGLDITHYNGYSLLRPKYRLSDQALRELGFHKD